MKETATVAGIIMKDCFITINNLTNTTITCCHHMPSQHSQQHGNNTSATHNNCTTEEREKVPWDWPPQPWNYIYVSLMIAIMCLVIVTNAGVIYKLNPFLARPKRHSNIELLILYLSASDLGTVLFLMADIYENLVDFKSWPFGWFGCKTMYPSFNVSLCVSVCMLVVMSVDRCRSITAPLRKKYPRRSIHAAAALSIVLSFAVNWFQFKHHVYTTTANGVRKCVSQRADYSFLRNKIVVTCVRDLIYFLVFTVTAYLIANSLRRHSLLVSENRNNNNNNNNKHSNNHQNRDRKADVIMMLITMETVFGILVLPYDVFDVAMMMSRLPDSDPIVFTETVWHIDRILAILQMSNSFANCFVYAKMHRYVARKSSSSGSAARQTSASSATVAINLDNSRRDGRRESDDVFGSVVNPNYRTSVFMTSS